jgi:hypothetical protein
MTSIATAPASPAYEAARSWVGAQSDRFDIMVSEHD